jgi:hypothetical protein
MAFEEYDEGWKDEDGWEYGEDSDSDGGNSDDDADSYHSKCDIDSEELKDMDVEEGSTI